MMLIAVFLAIDIRWRGDRFGSVAGYTLTVQGNQVANVCNGSPVASVKERRKTYAGVTRFFPVCFWHSKDPSPSMNPAKYAACAVVNFMFTSVLYLGDVTVSSKIIAGDSLTELRKLPSESVHTCITSPPYWGLRDYKIAGQLGLEKTPEEYVSKMVEVFREVKRVLRKDGTLWLVLGDSYAGSMKGEGGTYELSAKQNSNRGSHYGKDSGERHFFTHDLKPKNLCGIPWRVAFALQADGWWLRSDIIWAKPNPMPESVKDRPTKSHEHIFLLSQSQKYWYDYEAIMESVKESSLARLSQDVEFQTGSTRANGGAKINGPMKAVIGKKWTSGMGGGGSNLVGHSGSRGADGTIYVKRNKRDVWTVATEPFKDAHFAVFPEKLIEPCIKAGCPEGGLILDPFSGSGTTGVTAVKHKRNYIGIEINPEYVKMSERRIQEAEALFEKGLSPKELKSGQTSLL